MTGREALGEAIANEMGIDMSPWFMAAVDKIQLSLFLFGFKVRQIEGLENLVAALKPDYDPDDTGYAGA